MYPVVQIRQTRRLSLKQGGLRWWGRIGRICRSPRALTRMLALTPMGVAVAAISGLPAISVWAQATGNVIKPDGRTLTAQQVIGTRTDITTGTLRGDNAFNSFSRFEVGQGQTVNVVVPTQAQRVINLVTDAPIRIDGMLNGLKDGSLNGRLVFADPYGLVVGKSGVVNVGSLQVSAPTSAHMGALMNAQGQIGDAAVEQLLQGQAPRARDGVVRIDGSINALDRVAIQANRIEITGSIRAGADAAHEAAFRSAVNANGLRSAVGLMERGGVIELVSDEALLVSGSLIASQGKPVTTDAADLADSGLGGQVRLQGSDIVVQATALIDVSGASGGGSALLGDRVGQSLPGGTPVAAAASGDAVGAAAAGATPLTQSLVLAPGARVRADATERGDGGRIQFLSDGGLVFGGLASARGGALGGNGGFVEVSGRQRLQLQGQVDTTATQGRTGTLLIDPEDMHIADGSNGSFSVGEVQTLAAGSNLLLSAKDSITLGDSAGGGAVLNLSDIYLTPDQSITLLSRNITFNAGSRLLTGGGSVNLLALGDAAASPWFGSGAVYRYDVSQGFDAALKAGDVLAGGTIHLNPSAMIITRGVPAADPASAALLRNAGNITLRGKTLLLDAGSSLLAHSTGSDGFKGGQVELSAYAIDQNGLLKAEARAGLVLAGTVKADAITVNVVARAQSMPDSPYGIGDQDVDGLRDLGEFASGLLGVKALNQEAQADATLLVTGQAVLAAATDISLSAVSSNKAAAAVFVMVARDEAAGPNLSGAAAAAAAHVKTSGVADVRVQGGAALTAGGTLTLLAHNDATAKSSVKVLSDTATVGAALSIIEADVQANVHVDAGALLTIARLDLQALQTGNMRNIASSTLVPKAAENGSTAPAIGASVAISNIQASSVARLDADLRGNLGDVTLVADTTLWQNYIAARNMTGKAQMLDQLRVANPALTHAFEPLAAKLGEVVGEQLFEAIPAAPNLPFKGAAVLTLNQTDLQAEAVIGSKVNFISQGNVAVLAQTEDRAIHNIATSEVASKDTHDTDLSAAVAVGLYNHDARAVIKNDARIKARHVGLQSQVYQPLDITWLSLEDASPEALFEHLTPGFGMPQFVFSAWASATAIRSDAPSAAPLAATGSVNWTQFTNHATTSVEPRASIEVIGTDSTWQLAWAVPKAPGLDGDTWAAGVPFPGVSNILAESQVALEGLQKLAQNGVGELTGLIGGKAPQTDVTLKNSATFSKAIDIQARGESAFLTLAGQPAGLALFGTGGGNAVGASFNHAGAEHTTLALVADGVTFTALAGSVLVDAGNRDLVVAITPSAGKGQGAVVNLIGAFADLNNTTQARLLSTDTVTAKSLSLQAHEDLSVWTAAGSAGYSSGDTSVGVAVAANLLAGSTLAAILPGQGSQGRFTVDSLLVQATTQGTGAALSASAAAVDSSAVGQGTASGSGAGEADFMSKLAEKTKAEREFLGKSAFFGTALVQALDFVASAVGPILPEAAPAAPAVASLAASTAATPDAAPAPTPAPAPAPTSAPAPATTPALSLAGAGSSSISIGTLDTRALVQGARIDDGSRAGNSVTVRAIDETAQYALSGSIALLKLKSAGPGEGRGVSGAIAIDVEANTTSALLIDSSVSGTGRVTVEALSAGQRIAAGVGIAGSSGATSSGLLDASFSMIDTGNATLAGIEGGSIEGGRSAAVEVLAYDSTQTGAGAGALTLKLNSGGAAGAAVGVALLHNAVDAHLLGATLRQVGDVDVRAFDPVTVGLGAASLGLSAAAESATLAGSITYAELASTTSARVGIRTADRHDAIVESSGQVVVQASDGVPARFAARFEAEMAADGRPAADANLDFGAALRAGPQESFGGQSIGTSQPGALVISVAGGIAAGQAQRAAGAAAAVTALRNVHAASLGGATVRANSLRIDASDATLVVDVALGVAAQTATNSSFGLAGSVAVTQDDSRSSAVLGDAGLHTQVTTTGAVQIQATGQEKAFAVAGALAVTTQGKSRGIAAVYNEGSHVTEALLREAQTQVFAGTDVTVDASAASQHIGVAAAGGVAADKGGSTLSASLVLQDVSDRVSAQLADARVGARTLTVHAGDAAGQPTQVYSGAGSIGYSSGVQGGAAVTDNHVALRHDASVSRADLDLTGATSLQVLADNGARIIGVTLAGGASSKSSALNGAASADSVADRSSALVEGSTINSAGDVVVAASDRSRIDFATAAIAIGNSAAAGAAVAVNRIDNQVSALLQGTDSTGRGSAARLSAANLTVSASSDAAVVNATAGVGSGQNLGGAGAVAVNLINTEVTAHIGRGAVVAVSGSVAVLASRTDDIQAFGGALGLSSEVGIGLSATVNGLQGGTSASIGADNEALVTLDAQGAGSGLQVNSGVLTQALPGLTPAGSQPEGWTGLAAMTAYDAARKPMHEGVKTIHGVAVNATSIADVLSYDASAGISENALGLGGVSGAHVIQSTTLADISHARVNQADTTPADGQTVDVKASTHNVMATLALGAAAGGGAGGGAMGSDVFLTDTQARVRNATVRAQQDLRVQAGNEAAQSAILIGVAGGTNAALAGSVGVEVFEGSVQAAILDSQTRSGRDTTVVADNAAVLNVIAGAGGVGGEVGLGGGVSVMLSNTRTSALIGRQAAAAAATEVSTGGDLRVQADSSSSVNSLTVAISGGDAAAGAAIAAVAVITGTTTASVSGGATLAVGVADNWARPGASSGDTGAVTSDGTLPVTVQDAPTGTLTVAASDHGAAAQNSGAIGLGFSGGGIGGTVSVLLVRANVTASLSGAEIDAGNVNLQALNQQQDQAATIGVGAGSALGAGFAVSLMMLGTGSPDAEAFGTGAKGDLVMTAANKTSQADHVGAASAVLGAGDRDRLNQASRRDISGALLDAGSNSAAATVNGSHVRVTGDVTVQADQRSAQRNLAGAAGVAGEGVGAGGSVGISILHNASVADLHGGSLTAGGKLLVQATAGDAGGHKSLDLLSFAGALGFGGLGATVGIGRLDTTVSAQADGLLAAQEVRVQAQNSGTAKVENVVATLGGLVAGAAVSDLRRTGTVDAWVNRSGDAGNGVTAQNLVVNAADAGSAQAISVAAAAGLGLAATGAAATVNDDTAVHAGIGDKSQITVSIGSLVQGERTADLDGKAWGVGVSQGLQIGASVASVSLAGETTALVGKSVGFHGDGRLTVSAEEGAGNALKAQSAASGGGFMAAANASVATAENSATVTARIGDGSLLPDAPVDLAAIHIASQQASASGITVGGMLALGAAVAQAGSSAATIATLGNVQTSVARLGDLTVVADGSDRTMAKAMAGGGGLVSGQAAVALVSDTTSTRSEIAAWGAAAMADAPSYTVQAGAFNLAASHQASQRSEADTINASVVGGSGAIAKSTADNRVSATVGDDAQLRALALGVNALNQVHEIEGGDNAAGAGGGLANGSAVQAITRFTTASTVNVGDRAGLTVFGDPTDPLAGRLVLTANTDVAANTAGSLNTGGLIDVPYAEVTAESNARNTVTLGANATLHSVGDLVLGTTALNQMQANSLVKTYGGVSAAGGTSKASASQTDTISLGAAALLQAYGNVLVQTGRDAAGGLNEVLAQANTDVYNYTAVPITTTNKATASSGVTAALDLGEGSQIQAGRSVYLRTFEGDTQAHANGEGHNPYLELLSQSTQDSHAHDQFSGSIALNGLVTAGYYRRREISIAADGQTVQQVTDQPALQLPVLSFFVDAAGNYHQDNAQGALVDPNLALRPQGYIARIDGFNPSLYYDDKTKATFGKVPDAVMGAYAVPDLFAAGGSIEVNATSVSGAGQLVAQGGPLLQVRNASNRYLLVNKLVMPDEDSGGAVNFLGTGGKPATLQVNEVNKGRLAAISLHNSFNSDFGGLASDIVMQGAAATDAVAATVSNPRGSFTMVNDFGNVLSGVYDALTVEIAVPKGTFEVDSNGYYSVAGSPQTNWAKVAESHRPMDITNFVDTAAYAWYRQNIGSSTDLRDYATGLNGLTRNTNGSYPTGYLFKGLSNHRYDSSDGGDYVSWYGGHFRFELLPIKKLTYSGNDKNTSTTSKLTANRVDISAKYLDVNAPILAGSARDVDVTINNTKLYADHKATLFSPAVKSFSFFECVLNTKCLSFNGLKAEANGQYQVPDASLIFGLNSPHITVMFDKASGHVSTANIGSAATGAVSLSGMLLNSNALGTSRIELSSGAIKVNLNNQSGYVMDLPLIAAGSNGGAGVIRITDTGQTEAGKALTTWYVSGDGGATVAMYQSRTATSYEGLTPISGTSTLNGASISSYQPETGLAYDWTESAKARRQVKLANSGKWGETGVTSWEFLGANGSGTGLASPTWTMTAAGGQVLLKPTTNNYTTDLRVGQVDFTGFLVDYTNNAGKDKQTHPWQVATSIELLQHNTVKADHGIGISFKGYTDGGVTIASNATTYLGKTITNAGGNTSVTVSKGDLIGQQGGLLAARNLNLAVAAGRLGGDVETKALAVLQDAGGTLNASAGGDLALQSLGALTLGTVKAGTLGTVSGAPAQLTLQALGDITAASLASTVSGYNLSLTSQNGRIGGLTADTPLPLNLITIPQRTGSPTLPVLTAQAHGDVALKLTGGDVRIDSIQSADGRVTLATAGSLYDNKAGQGAEDRDANSLLTLWQDKLHLTDASGKNDRTAAVADMLLHTIAPLDQQVNRDYQAWWALQALGTAAQGGGSFTLTAAGVQALRAQAAARYASTQVSDAQVNAYANELLAGYGKTFASLLDSKWQERAEFQTRQTNFRFSADRYNEYWQLQNATVAGQLTAAGTGQVRAIAATVLGAAPSDVQLQAYVDQRLSDLGRDFTSTLGSDWAAKAAFKTYDPGYQFAPDQALLKVYATGSYWDLAMLQNSIRSVALESGGGASSGSFDHLNIVGRQVSLTSSGDKAALGQSDGVLTMSLGAPLSDAVKLALSQASAPGDVLTVVDSLTGKITGLAVKNNRPIFLQASGQFDATFEGQIAVQAQDSLQIGSVTSSGAVRLSAQDGIAMAVAGAGLIQGATLVLDGGGGSLGSLSADGGRQALLIQTPALSLARAGGNLLLSQATGNMLFDAVTGGQSVELRAEQGSLAQKQPGLLSLVGQDVRLVARDDLGGAGAASLNAQINGGELTLVGQNVWLNARSGAGASGFSLGSSTVKANLVLATPGSTGLTLSGASTVAGQATLAVGGAITSLPDSALAVGGSLALSADSAAFGALHVTGNADLQVTNALWISGLGQFDANLSGHAASMRFGTLRVGGTMQLTTDMLEPALGSVQIDRLDVGGDADISAGGLLALRGNVTVGGALTASATDSLRLQDLQVGQGLSLQAGTALWAERVSSGGNAQMNSGGTLTLATLSAHGVKLDAVRDMQLDLLRATHADLSTATQIALREGRIADSITLRADKVQAGLVSSAGDGMVTELTGFQGQRASTVVVTMDTPSAWQMPVLNAVNAQLSTNGSSTAIAVASIGAGLRLSTPDGVVAMNNQAQGLSGGAAVQLFTPTQDFALVRDGKQLDTSATLVSQRGDQTVAAPRLFTPVAGQIPTTGLAVSGPAAGSNGGRSMAGSAGTQAAANGPLSALFPQLRRLANGQWDFDALRRDMPLSRQTEAVGDLEF